MPGTQSARALLLLAACCACAPARTGAPAPAAATVPPPPTAPDPRTPPQSPRATCEIHGDGDGVEGDIRVVSDSDPPSPRFVIRESSGVSATWTNLGSESLAHIEIGGQQMLRASGRAKRPTHLEYRRDVDLGSASVLALQGELAGPILREEADAVWLREETGLVEPPAVEAKVPCNALHWGYVERVPPVPGTRTSYLLGTTFTLLSAPGGAPALRVVAAKPVRAVLLEETGEFARVRTSGGVANHAGALHRFQGWIEKRSLTQPETFEVAQPDDYSYSTRAPKLKRLDRRLALDDAPVFLDDAPTVPIATLERGASVIPKAFSVGSLVAFELERPVIQAPEGRHFLVDRSALGTRDEPAH